MINRPPRRTAKSGAYSGFPFGIRSRLLRLPPISLIISRITVMETITIICRWMVLVLKETRFLQLPDLCSPHGVVWSLIHLKSSILLVRTSSFQLVVAQLVDFFFSFFVMILFLSILSMFLFLHLLNIIAEIILFIDFNQAWSMHILSDGTYLIGWSHTSLVFNC